MTGDQEVTERTQLILTQAFEDLASGGIIAHRDIFVNPYDVTWKMNQLFLLKSSFFKDILYSCFRKTMCIFLILRQMLNNFLTGLPKSLTVF